jgi:hypothetical protein
MKKPLLFIVLCAVSAVGLALAEEAGTTAYDRLRATPLDGRAIQLSEFTLERDAFSFSLSGTAYLLEPVEGQEWGVAFVGNGSMILSPATEDERYHLGIRTGDRGLSVLSDTFESAVFFATDGTVAELLRSGEVKTGTPPANARAALDMALKRQRKNFKTNFQIRILQDLLSQTDRPGVFIALPNTKKLPPCVAIVDPLGAGRSMAMKTGPEEVMLAVSFGERTGGLWYMAHLTSELASGAAKNCRDHRITDATHYSIDTRIKRNEDVEGSTTITFTPLSAGERVLPLVIAPALRLDQAGLLSEDGENVTALQVIQEDKDQDADAALVFPKALAEGTDHRVRLNYAGDETVMEVSINYYVVGDRSTWYPNLGAFSDTATYDLTFRTTSSKARVVSVGELVSEEDHEGGRITSWKTDHPVQVAGFNFGDFEVDSRQDEIAKMTIELFSPRSPGFGLSGLSDNVMADAINSARLFTNVFGPLSFSRVAVSQQPQFSFGQAWPTLVYLPAASFVNQTLLGASEIYGIESFIDTVGAHEMSHQWWGHEIGWGSYRDQWLSEGFATFSANYFIQRTQNWKEHDKIYKQQQDFISEKNGNYKNHTVGPITMGWRLSTNRSPSAYSALAYYKGSFVLHMLRMMMMDSRSQNPDERFFTMLTDFIDTYRGEFPSTDDFKRVVEKHIVPQLDANGNGKMDWFFDQWVYGTEIPTLESNLAVTRAGKEWRIQGTIAQSGVSENFLTLVPIYVDFGKDKTVLLGRMPLRGEATQRIDRTMAMPQTPRKVLINAHYDVLSLNASKKKSK